MAWLVAYRRNNQFAWTVVQDVWDHKRMMIGVDGEIPLVGPRFELVYAQFFEIWGRAEAALNAIESLPTDSSIRLIESVNPKWLDYWTHFPERLDPPGGDGGAGAAVPRPLPPDSPLLTLFGGNARELPGVEE